MLNNFTKNLKLSSAIGEKYCEFESKINGVIYYMGKNNMGIKTIRLNFNKSGGSFEYTNKQGKKEIFFGRCENVFGVFPQEGYSNETGSQITKNFYYKCACSAAWIEPQKLFLKVQITDKYFGRLNITFGFRSNYVGVYMTKCAENFLDEYNGFAGGKCSELI